MFDFTTKARKNQHSTAQHSTAQHSTAQHSTLALALAKKISLAALISFPLLSLSAPAQAVDGCKALLCFAGGMHVSECQPTIREVIHDMSRGKPFPTCSSAQNMGIQTALKQKTTSGDHMWSRGSICPDGKTKARVHHERGEGYDFTCKYVDIKIPANISADKEHQHQKHYY